MGYLSVYLLDEKLDTEKLCREEEMYNKIMLKGYDVRIWGDDANQLIDTGGLSLSRLCPVKAFTLKKH